VCSSKHTITNPTWIALESNQGLRSDTCCSGWYGSAYCHPVERCKLQPCYHRSTYTVSRVHYRRDIYDSHVRCCYSSTPPSGRKRQCLSLTTCSLQTHLQQSLMYAHVHITTFHGSIFAKKDVEQVVTVSSVHKYHKRIRSSRALDTNCRPLTRRALLVGRFRFDKIQTTQFGCDTLQVIHSNDKTLL